MHPLEKKTLALLQANMLLPPGTRAIVAVSAGPDSMALLHTLAQLADTLELTLMAAYVNHGLRPQEAGQEEELVRTQAGKLGLAFTTGSVEVRPYARRHKLSVEHGARLLRYAFLEKAARLFQASRIILAHTADDQAEEVLLRLIRGTGRAGLSGMKLLREDVPLPTPDFPGKNQGGTLQLIRPFLLTPKADLLAYLADRDLAFCEDSSNRDPAFFRNRIRHTLMPFLAEHFNPNIGRTLRRTAEILRDEEDLLAQVSSAALDSILLPCPRPQPKTAVADSPALRTVDLQAFLAQPRAIQRRILETICWHMKIRPGFEQIRQLMAIARAEEKELRTHLASGLRVQKSHNRLIFSFPQGRGGLRGELGQPDTSVPWQLEIPEPGRYQLPGQAGSIVFDLLDHPPARPLAGDEERTQYLDMARLTFPLTLRTMLPGDRFTPLGAPGSKKISDFLCDLKIPLKKRAETAILLSAGRIVALPGLRIDDHYRLTAATETTLAIRRLP